jgi:II/X family phage/plasmid replication protein
MNELVYQVFKKIYENHPVNLNCLEDINFTFLRIKKGDYLVKMIDVNFLFDVGNDQSVESWLHAAEMNARTRGGRSCRDKGTVYLQKKSRRWAFKFYNKLREISSKSKTHRLHLELENSGLKEFIAGKIRAELRLMSLELKELKLTHGYHFTESKLIELFNTYLGRINMTNQVTLIDEKLLNLPLVLQATYQLWRQGASLKDLMSKPTYYRHRKLLLEQGIDITFPPLNSALPNNVFPLMRIIEAIPVANPQWAYDQGLIAA